ncbi:MAG: hypothetical protein KC561_01360 [Myxococcales bacterium]|nr:hypothetical protein [Myxococcales bacterium]
MKNNSRLIGSLLVLASLLLATGCTQVNEMPSYSARIQAIEVSSAVVRPGEVSFMMLAGRDMSDPNQAAVEVTEQRIRERLLDRLDQLAHPAIVADVATQSLIASFERRLPWEVYPASSAEVDASFRVEITEYGVEVDQNGLATVHYTADITGFYLPDNVLIYEETVRSSVPLTEEHRGQDPASAAAARALNLLTLDQLSEDEFQQRIFYGADLAADDVALELADDTF